MTNILLILLLTVNIALLSIVLLAIRRVSHVFYEVKSFITPAAEGQSSPLASTIDAVSSVFARSIVAQAKTTFMGIESGRARQEKAIQGDLALDVASQAGGIAGLLTKFPSVAKHIRRNPGLVDAALQILGNMGGQGGQPAGDHRPAIGSNGHKDSMKLGF